MSDFFRSRWIDVPSQIGPRDTALPAGFRAAGVAAGIKESGAPDVGIMVSDSPETINEDPYGEGWLVRVRLSNPSETESLMDAATYEAGLE